jgi:nitronate monooxygenase
LAHRLAALAVPVIAAPMFLVSGPKLVLAACRAGIGAGFPAANARTLTDLEGSLDTISAGLDGLDSTWLVNVIAHRTYERLGAETRLLARYRPPLVVTALGSPQAVVETVHDYGGSVLADVSTPAQAQRAVQRGVDGLVLVCAGAGGHTGTLTPLAFVPTVRRFWDGPLLVAGGVADGRAVLACRALGADAAYVGTRFVAATESLAGQGYRRMLTGAGVSDLVTSSAVTGAPVSWLRDSLRAAGHRVEDVARSDFVAALTDSRPWRDLWSAGHGVELVQAEEPVARIVATLTEEYRAALAAHVPSAAPATGARVRPDRQEAR